MENHFTPSLDSDSCTAPPRRPWFGHKIKDIACRLGLCILSGALLFLSCAKKEAWMLGWVGFFPLLVALFDREGQPVVKRPFLYGWVTGIVMIAGGFAWMVPFLGRFGNLPLLVSLVIFALFAAYHGLVFGIFSSLICFLQKELRLPFSFSAALCFTCCEFVFPCIFPWYIGSSQAFVPLAIQVADITGPLGVSFLLVLFSASMFEIGTFLFHKKRPIRALASPILAVFVVLLSLVYGKIRIAQIDTQRAQAVKVNIGLVQPNIGMDVKFRTAAKAQLAKLQEGSLVLEQAGADLILWPESSYPISFPYPMPLSRDMLQDFPEQDPWKIRRGFAKPLLFGAMTEDSKGVYNTVMFMNNAGQITNKSDKNYLLIFGEYVPFWELLRGLKKWIPNISNTTPGTTINPFPFEHQGKTYYLGPLICYEDIIPAFGRRLLNANHPSNLLINFTNDAWFGDTQEPNEHLALSVFRSVEHRLDMVRVTNTGVSAYIDAAGRIYGETKVVDPHGKQVDATLALKEAALLSPSGFYQSLGDAFGALCLLLVLIFYALAKHKARMSIQMTMIAGSMFFLHGVILLSTLVVNTDRRSMYALLLHRNESAFSSEQLLSATITLWPILAIASLLLGIVLELWHQMHVKKNGILFRANHVRLEIIAALLSVTVLPVALFGRMEGNTGQVVIGTGLCVLFAMLGEFVVFVSSRRSRLPNVPVQHE